MFLTMLMLVRKFFLTSTLPPPPPPPLRKNVFDLVKILGNVGQNMTTPPPPNVDVFATLYCHKYAILHRYKEPGYEAAIPV
jgi:hypothetical protein